MKKNILFIQILIFVMSLSSFGQQTSIVLSFIAQYDDQYSFLDSIYIKNLTQGFDTILYSPDTNLVLDIGTNINTKKINKQNCFKIEQNFPNPFNGVTTFNLYLAKKDLINISIVNLLGQEIANYKNSLFEGYHTFQFSSGNEKIYILRVNDDFFSRTIKMININENNGSKNVLKYVGHNKNYIPKKSQKKLNNFIFQLGDTLRYIGYGKIESNIIGSDIIENAPVSNDTIVFQYIKGIPCLDHPFIEYESQIYRTIQIGNQCWLKSNLNVGIMIDGSQEMENNNLVEKYCYNNIEDSCTIYGGLYQWNELMQYDLIPGVQGICPEGWHIPTDYEWNILEGTVDSIYNVGDPIWEETGYRGYDAGKNLKTLHKWNINYGYGIDKYGYSGLPGGWRQMTGAFVNLKFAGYFWTSTENSLNYAWERNLEHDDDNVYRNVTPKYNGFSVRCIKN